MAFDTPKYFRNLVIYEIYVRNHGPNGTFPDVEADLHRIKSLGVDAIWLMPIHPIGSKLKKGSLGCPYSIKDYGEVNPEYGTLSDFKKLLAKAHSLDLKVIIDVVFNHTAHDSVLAIERPEWFVQDKHGSPTSTVSDWSDVVDLKFPNSELEAYLIDTMKSWINIGVDGFRCDVASLIPVEFWFKARNAVKEIKQEFIWLAESVDAKWIAERRENGYPMCSDSELYEAFDITYDYDIWPIWNSAVLGNVDNQRYVEMLKFQDCIYPQNFIKLRCVENHDRKRIMSLAPTPSQALAWTAFQAFNKGAFLIYSGQESAAGHNPSLFENDKIEWKEYELQEFIAKLVKLKKDQAQLEGIFHLLNSASGIQAAWIHPEGSLYGIFNTETAKGKINIPLEDGCYEDLLNSKSIIVNDGKAVWPEDAAIIRYSNSIKINPLSSSLLNLES